MKKIFFLLLILGFFPLSLEAQDPELWISLKPSTEEHYWLVYREETFSELYKPANGTIIPMAVFKVDPKKNNCWGILPLVLKDEQVIFDFCLRSSVPKQERITHSFFSKGKDRQLAPSVICSENCFRIQIPEESGQTRNIVIQRGADIESFKKAYKVSPLIPAFTWDKIMLFEM